MFTLMGRTSFSTSTLLMLYSTEMSVVVTLKQVLTLSSPVCSNPADPLDAKLLFYSKI